VNVLEQLAIGWQSLWRTVREMGRPALWAPWLVLAAAQLAVVALLWGFAHPLVSWFMAPLVRRFAGEGALHYPDVFRAMPLLASHVDVLFGALLGAILTGAATVLFAQRFRGHPLRPGEALGLAVRRSWTLVLAQLPFNVLIFALSYGLEWLVESRSSSGVTRRIVYLAVLGGSVALQALFFYVAALVMLEGRGVVQAWAALPRTWSRGFAAALMLGALMILPLFPTSQLLQRSDGIVERGTPELVGVLLLLQLLLGLGVWFVLSGTATLVYLSVLAPPDEAEGWVA
jgi:hypothetical protein